MFSLLEPCRTFRMIYGEGYPRIVSALRECLSLYFYPSLSAEDVLVFLGRKLHGNFQGEVLNDAKKRAPGARVKHRMGATGFRNTTSKAWSCASKQ